MEAFVLVSSGGSGPGYTITALSEWETVNDRG